ncbi:hypothetical protein PGTUg99_010187 [Puccinia graminis f. sp. tritici]|uniref:Uncharacterized protein n=1 Tax=Puccinia graminis f. sp. tritici TaxID=56615 RepID=A0A5B0QGZ8_PUCGR|nr:hypothetical protein PGTUg99_010187 [Puccinia graminis f. sp. tritici]
MVSILILPGPPGRDPCKRLAASSWWRTEDQRQPTRLGLVTQYSLTNGFCCSSTHHHHRLDA